MNRVSVAAYAKTNLALRILNREPSGYHRIETLFALLDLHDELTVERTEADITVSVRGADTGPERDNLAYRAADMILEDVGRPFGVRIELTKSIPVQAGLGGGSSDGAATLHAVNMLAGNPVSHEQIMAHAAELGSDVPFFASRFAYAAGRGRGELLAEVAGPPRAPALIVVPEFGISTREAYESLDTLRLGGKPQPTGPLPLEDITDWSTARELSVNDFEVVLFRKMPRLGELYSNLDNTGAILTRLCGSGSAVIAVYTTTEERDAATRVISSGERTIPTAVRGSAATFPVPV